MYRIRKNGSTSNVERCRLLQDGTGANPGYGKAGIAFGTSGLVISTITDMEATPTVYTAAGGTIETITTCGTYVAPTATKCRFKEIDSVNNPGDYELHFADARYAVAGAKTLRVTISGVAGMLPKSFVVQLTVGNDIGVEVDSFLASALIPAVTVSSPIATNLAVTVLQGDSYFNVDGRALEWTGLGWPDLAGATVSLTLFPPKAGFLTTKAMSVIISGGPLVTQKVRCEPTSTDTANMQAFTYPYHVVATLANGHVATLVDSAWTTSAT